MVIRIEFPDDLTTILRSTPEEIGYDLKLRALAGLVERGLISSSRAAQLGGVSRREFLDWCGRWQVRIHCWDDADLDAEISWARGERAR